MKIIAVSGLARSGKDTIANKLQRVIIENNPNLKVSRESFASFLKDEMNEFVLSKFNKNIY
jgi:thymidylate kinase